MSQTKHQILLESGTNEVEFLLFQVGVQRYGINVAKVRQILLFDPASLAVIPKQLPEILGLMKFRDKTISIVDLRMHLGTPAANEENPRPLLMVTEFNQRTTGFIVDAVHRIERCSWKQFEPIGDTTLNSSNGSVVGTVSLKDGIVVILDLETTLSIIDPSSSIENSNNEIASGSIDRSKISILYCEDSAIVRKMLTKTLSEAGFQRFHVFSTGQEGLDFLKSPSCPPIDIIVSDIEMPQMDGLTFCKHVKSDPKVSAIPFVFFSSMIDEQMEKKCRSVGGDGAFSKPQLNRIVDAIERTLSGHKWAD